MKILIIIPSRSHHGQSGYADFPDEMLSVAGMLESCGHIVRLFDCNIEQKPVADILDQFLPRLVILFVSTGPEIIDAIYKTDELKRVSPQIQIAWCGCHPTGLPEVTLSEPNIDYIILGAGENALCELAAALEKNDTNVALIKGIGFKDICGKIILTEPRLLMQNPDILPDPAWHLVDIQRYPDFNLSLSRGGPYKTTFFPDMPFGSEIPRSLSIGRIMSQLAHVCGEMSVKHIYFSGQPLHLNEFLKELCQSIQDKKLKINWTIPVSDIIDGETIRLMKRAGCVSVLFEIGTASPELRAVLGKPAVSILENNFWQFVKNHLVPTLFMMYGYPNETKTNFEETIAFITRLDNPPYLLMRYVPYPGTRLFEHYRENNLIDLPSKLENWAEFHEKWTISDKNGSIPKEVINSALADYRKTYAIQRIRFAIRHNPGYFIAMIKHPVEFYRKLIGLIRYYFEIAIRKSQ